MPTTTSSSVAADRAAIRSSIAAFAPDWSIPKPNAWRSVLDIAVDWTLIGVAVWAAVMIGKWILPFAIFVNGNRQRALGNLLHDAGHQNLSTRRKVNERIAHMLLAPPLFDSLKLYRHQHARHHAWLGDPNNDPDFIPRTSLRSGSWFHAYARVLADPATWIGSFLGHIPSKRLAARQRLGIFLWWGIFEAVLTVMAGLHVALLFLSLWMISRGTAFHAITVFRELTDHYGLEPRGIFRYTRDIPDHGIVSMLLHPHHNGYHLTHHLFPHIPYHHLPSVHAHLKQIPFFDRRAIVCDAYLSGSRSAVQGWGAQHG